MSSDPILDSLAELTAEAAGAPGKTHHVDVGAGALERSVGWLWEHSAEKSHRVVCDAHTKTAAADALADKLRAKGATVELLVVEPARGDDHLVCDDAAIERVQAELGARPHENAIAVGAGTINDVVKMATFKLGRPYQCLATAASMNGYTSSIAAVLSRGVKRTLPAQQAQAVFADTEVLCAAPSYLNLAGFGDLLSKPYSNADWKLSSLVRGVPFEDRPAALLDDAFERLLEDAAKIGAADASGVQTLAATIVLSGFTMAIAGTSAPASGGEHLVSHYWDMEQHCNEEPLLGLHGTQVGIATRMSALLFERLVAIDPRDIDPAALATRREPPSVEHLARIHPRLTSAIIEEVFEQIRAKQRTGKELEAELSDVKARWPQIVEELNAVLMPSQRITDALAQAGAADRPSALGVTREHAVAVQRHCRHIRSRYVGLDLLDDLGLLHDAAADVVDAVER